MYVLTLLNLASSICSGQPTVASVLRPQLQIYSQYIWSMQGKEHKNPSKRREKLFCTKLTGLSPVTWLFYRNITNWFIFFLKKIIFPSFLPVFPHPPLLFVVLRLVDLESHVFLSIPNWNCCLSLQLAVHFRTKSLKSMKIADTPHLLWQREQLFLPSSSR